MRYFMRWASFKLIYTIVIVSISVGFYLAQQSGLGIASPSVEVLNIEPDTLQMAFTSDHQHPEQIIIQAVKKATKTIDLAVYALTHRDIASALIEAKNRGVAVRVISDRQQSGGKDQKKILTMLNNAKIPILINSHQGLMHLKLGIIDQHVVMWGSFNWTYSASTKNDEMLTAIADEKLAIDWTERFDHMWNDQKRFERWR